MKLTGGLTWLLPFGIEFCDCSFPEVKQIGHWTLNSNIDRPSHCCWGWSQWPWSWSQWPWSWSPQSPEKILHFFLQTCSCLGGKFIVINKAWGACRLACFPWCIHLVLKWLTMLAVTLAEPGLRWIGAVCAFSVLVSSCPHPAQGNTVCIQILKVPLPAGLDFF